MLIMEINCIDIESTLASFTGLGDIIRFAADSAKRCRSYKRRSRALRKSCQSMRSPVHVILNGPWRWLIVDSSPRHHRARRHRLHNFASLICGHIAQSNDAVVWLGTGSP